MQVESTAWQIVACWVEIEFRQQRGFFEGSSEKCRYRITMKRDAIVTITISGDVKERRDVQVCSVCGEEINPGCGFAHILYEDALVSVCGSFCFGILGHSPKAVLARTRANRILCNDS